MAAKQILLLSALLCGVAAPATAQPGAKTLTGTFYGTIMTGEYEDALILDEVVNSLDPAAIIRVEGAGRPEVERAVQTLELISMVNAEPPGKAVRAKCSAKCKVTGTIAELEPGAWWFQRVNAVEALPDGFDFMSLSDGGAPADQKSKVSGEPPRDVGAGDPLRKTLLDTLRPAIEADLGQPVQFVVRTLRKQNDWAFAHVVPQTKSGASIDFARTRYAEALREGMFDGADTFALLEQKHGRWTVKAFVVGPTDVTYAGWPDEYGAPYPLFGLPVP